MVISAKLTDHGVRFVDGSRDEVSILSMGCVPVASIEDSNRLIIKGGKTFKVSDEAVLVVDLE